MGGDDKPCTERFISAAGLGAGAGAVYGAVRSAWGVIPEEVVAGQALGPSVASGATTRIMSRSIGAFAAVGGIFAATDCVTANLSDNTVLTSALAGCVAGAVAGASGGQHSVVGKTVAGCLGFALLAGVADFAGGTMLPNRSARVQAKQHTYGGTGSVAAATHGGHGGH